MMSKNTKKLLRKIGIGEEQEDPIGNGSKQVEAVLVSSTSNSSIYELLKKHKGESEEQRQKILNGINQLFSGIEQKNNANLEDRISELMQIVDVLLSRIEELESRLAKLEQSKVSREQYQKLNEELTKFQDDWLFQYVEPAVKKLINLYDDAPRLVQDPGVLEEIILEILKRLNVRKIDQASSTFSPQFQKAVKTIKTQEKSKDKEVKDVLNEGFKYLEQRTIRPQKVSIYKFNPKEEGDSNER